MQGAPKQEIRAAAAELATAEPDLVERYLENITKSGKYRPLKSEGYEQRFRFLAVYFKLLPASMSSHQENLLRKATAFFYPIGTNIPKVSLVDRGSPAYMLHMLGESSERIVEAAEARFGDPSATRRILRVLVGSPKVFSPEDWRGEGVRAMSTYYSVKGADCELRKAIDWLYATADKEMTKEAESA